MEYEGYVGTVEFSEADGLFFGKVVGIRSLISYEGTTAKELVDDFHGAVDDYLLLCQDQGIAPELHKRAMIYAMGNQMSLNSFVEEAIFSYVASKDEKRK